MAIVVKRGPDESPERLIARFRKKVQNLQFLVELREREFYESPSARKNKKMSLFRKMNKKRRKR